MPDFVTLVGAEDVQRAGHMIARAASDMATAAASIDSSVQRYTIESSGLEGRLEQLVERLEAHLAAQPPQPTDEYVQLAREWRLQAETRLAAERLALVVERDRRPGRAGDLVIILQQALARVDDLRNQAQDSRRPYVEAHELRAIASTTREALFLWLEGEPPTEGDPTA